MMSIGIRVNRESALSLQRAFGLMLRTADSVQRRPDRNGSKILVAPVHMVHVIWVAVEGIVGFFFFFPET